MKNDLSGIGSRIKFYRTRQHMSQFQLSELADITPVYLSLIETGQRTPSLEVLTKISSALCISMDLLVYGIAPEKSISEWDTLLAGCSEQEKEFVYELAKSALNIIQKHSDLQ